VVAGGSRRGDETAAPASLCASRDQLDAPDARRQGRVDASVVVFGLQWATWVNSISRCRAGDLPVETAPAQALADGCLRHFFCKLRMIAPKTGSLTVALLRKARAIVLAANRHRNAEAPGPPSDSRRSEGGASYGFRNLRPVKAIRLRRARGNRGGHSAGRDCRAPSRVSSSRCNVELKTPSLSTGNWKIAICYRQPPWKPTSRIWQGAGSYSIRTPMSPDSSNLVSFKITSR
jgi:hypothetical protein